MTNARIFGDPGTKGTCVKYNIYIYITETLPLKIGVCANKKEIPKVWERVLVPVCNRTAGVSPAPTTKCTESKNRKDYTHTHTVPQANQHEPNKVPQIPRTRTQVSRGPRYLQLTPKDLEINRFTFKNLAGQVMGTMDSSTPRATLTR